MGKTSKRDKKLTNQFFKAFTYMYALPSCINGEKRHVRTCVHYQSVSKGKKAMYIHVCITNLYQGVKSHVHTCMHYQSVSRGKKACTYMYALPICINGEK